jgi:hypothetical protein
VPPKYELDIPFGGILFVPYEIPVFAAGGT